MHKNLNNNNIKKCKNLTTFNIVWNENVIRVKKCKKKKKHKKLNFTLKKFTKIFIKNKKKNVMFSL